VIENTVEYYKIIIVNNGAKELEDYVVGDTNIVYTGENMGWQGGCNAGLAAIDEPCDYVVFLNDDTLILPHHYDWIHRLKTLMDKDPAVAAVGPASNVVAGLQNFMHRGLPAYLETKYLIGFCVMMRKKYFEEIGCMDEALQGGDDFDWSIRYRQAGYKIVARRDTFVFHHGFKTGERVHGAPHAHMGWNSQAMQERTNHEIIRKHGFKNWLETVRNVPVPYDLNQEEYEDGGVLKKITNGKGIDVGCGQNKITPETIGVDLCISGEENPQGHVSEADVRASGDNLHMFKDEELDYVVARHNIEHYSNPFKALREWNRVLKKGGKLGLTTPDDTRLSALRLDDTHKFSFNREGLKELIESTGFAVEELGGTKNQWNVYAIAEKV
jgi:hypothetical protein